LDGLNLEFNIYHTQVVIKPSGYLYSEYTTERCIIGIESMDEIKEQGEEEQERREIGASTSFRLGTIFLRNLYIALDYEENKLGFAEYEGSESTEII